MMGIIFVHLAVEIFYYWEVLRTILPFFACPHYPLFDRAFGPRVWHRVKKNSFFLLRKQYTQYIPISILVVLRTILNTYFNLTRWYRTPGTHDPEPTTLLCSCNGAFTDRSIFRLNSREWDSRRSPMTNYKKLSWRHRVTLFFSGKDSLKIDRSVKMPLHRPSMGAVGSGSWVPENTNIA